MAGLDAKGRTGLDSAAAIHPQPECIDMAEVTCARCGQTREGLAFAPFNNDLGKRIHAGVCQACWADWLKQQTMLINHYGLNLRDPDAKKFLFDQTEKFLFQTGETDQVDTSKQGTIQW